MSTTDPARSAPAVRDGLRIGFLAQVEHTGVAAAGESFLPELPGGPVPPVSSRGLRTWGTTSATSVPAICNGPSPLPCCSSRQWVGTPRVWSWGRE
jgi:hypothetical protein